MTDNRRLFQDLGNDTCTNRSSALTNRKPQLLFHRDRRDQLDRHLRVVARHHHLDACRELDAARHVRRAEVELRPVALEERRMAASLFLVRTYTSASKFVCGLIVPGLASTIPRSI